MSLRETYDILHSLLPWVVEAELEGVELDIDKITEIRPYFDDRLAELQSQAWELAGHEFNLESSPQKNKLLFDELNLTKTKPTDATRKNPRVGQYQTTADELRHIAGNTP
jgi:DNA polymerase I